MRPQRQFSPSLIRALEVLVAVAEAGQMRAGARLLGLTQPSASQHIANLEAAYGVTLFDRSMRPTRLTPAGRLLHRQAVKILNSLSDMEAAMRHVGPHPIGMLRVGLQASVATTLTPGLVAMARGAFGVTDVTLHAGQSGDHERLLRTKQADLALTSNPFYDLDGLERHDVLRERFLLVLPPDHEGPDHSLEAIQADLPLVRFADSTHVGRQTMQHLRRLRFAPSRMIEVDRSSMVTACVTEGMGFSLLTPTLLIDGLVEHMRLRILPLPVAGMSRSLTVVAREGELAGLPAAFAAEAGRTLRRRIGELMGDAGLSALLDAR
ncbi:LysR family transcriptional regulator [Roseovarius spongiae]|uniref:LysR family transcriptional regulator n=1 Tax=Roseovarius spongiae TaxID=2320272 RepID=A0A3A8BBI4_9RHOB|nr:LysR family transcriptional regulator [Roseovarius spongiae]RKF16772.1 LysR family transcriptional regulator [Roseovarius spongiae]